MAYRFALYNRYMNHRMRLIPPAINYSKIIAVKSSASKKRLNVEKHCCVVSILSNRTHAVRLCAVSKYYSINTCCNTWTRRTIALRGFCITVTMTVRPGRWV